MITREAPNGTLIEFPDGTPEETIQEYLSLSEYQLPKENEDVFTIRWKLRLTSKANSPESRTLLEKNAGLDKIADYTKYLSDIGAQADSATLAAIEAIIEASGKLILEHEKEESITKIKSKEN